MKGIINLDLSIEEKLEKVIYFFHENYEKWEITETLESFYFIFKNLIVDLDPRYSALFFADTFFLGDRYFSDSEKSQIFQVILPALALEKLKDSDFDISKIIGGIIQLDREDHFGYQISQIFDYKLEKRLIDQNGFISILKNIIVKNYASGIRVGRLMGNFIKFSIFKLSEIIEIILKIRLDPSTNIKIISDLIMGLKSIQLSEHDEQKIIKEILVLDNPELNPLKTHVSYEDQVAGLARVLSNYFYNNFSIFPILNLSFSLENKFVLADSFKYMIDNMMISLKQLTLVLRRYIYQKRLKFKLIPRFITSKFSKYEISEFIGSLFENRDDDINNISFGLFLTGFYNTQLHGFKREDLKQIIVHLRKINPNLLNSLNVGDNEEFLDYVESKCTKKLI